VDQFRERETQTVADLRRHAQTEFRFARLPRLIISRVMPHFCSGPYLVMGTASRAAWSTRGSRARKRIRYS
jgi:hypothetical protein